MTTIIIKPKTKEEEKLLAQLLKKMNIEASFVEAATPNLNTIKAMEDVENRIGTWVKNSEELFQELGI